MKAHLGVDAPSGLVHSVTGTAANVADIAQTHALLHGQEKAGYADAGYLGVEKREEILSQCPGVEWHVAAKRGKIKAMAEAAIKELTQQLEKLKAQVRARVDTISARPTRGADWISAARSEPAANGKDSRNRH